MPKIGLLEGQRLKYRLGAAFVDPAAWVDNGQNNHNRELFTTDWPSLYSQDPSGARGRYVGVNVTSLDPDMYPTLDAWLSAHGGIPQVTPANVNILPDPPTQPVNQPVIVVPNRVTDPVINPVPSSVVNNYYSTNVTTPDPAPSTGTPAADTAVANATDVPPQAKSMVLPLLALAAAWMVLK